MGSPPPRPRVVAVPSDRAWFDPGLIIRTTQVQWRDVTLAVGSGELLAGNNPSRLAIGFVPIDIVPATLTVAPWSDFPNGIGIVASFTTGTFFKLFDWGPLVCGDWYGIAAAGSVHRVVEVTRLD